MKPHIGMIPIQKQVSARVTGKAKQSRAALVKRMLKRMGKEKAC